MTSQPYNSSFEKLNEVIKLSLETSLDPHSKALQIARVTGAFNRNNVVFVHNQLYAINPQNPQQSIQHLKMIKQQKVA